VLVIDQSRTPPIGFSMFLPSGLPATSAPTLPGFQSVNSSVGVQTSTDEIQPSAEIAQLAQTAMPDFWLLNANLPFDENNTLIPIQATIDNLGRIVYNNSLTVEAPDSLYALLVTPGLQSSATGIIAASTMIANGFTGLVGDDINTNVYVINGASGSFAIGGGLLKLEKKG
jgi:hypothetical protein